MKHTLRFAWHIFLICALLLPLVSCGGLSSQDAAQRHDCTGEYDFLLTKESAGDCQNLGYKAYTCQTCGFVYRVYNTDKGDHYFSDTYTVIVEPDYGKEGLKARKCRIQGCYAYVDEVVIEPLETDFPPLD